MNVRFTGRHVGVPEADRDYVEKKIAGLAKYHRGLDEVEVRVMMDGTVFERVELEADLGSRRVVARSDALQFRPAFDGAAVALKHQLLKLKEKVVGRRRRAGRKDAKRGSAA